MLACPLLAMRSLQDPPSGSFIGLLKIVAWLTGPWSCYLSSTCKRGCPSSKVNAGTEHVSEAPASLFMSIVLCMYQDGWQMLKKLFPCRSWHNGGSSSSTVSIWKAEYASEAQRACCCGVCCAERVWESQGHWRRHRLGHALPVGPVRAYEWL